MLLKWIVCQVTPGKRWDFSRSQEQWAHISKADGFLGQFGGWDTKRELDACVLSLWESSETYDKFMREVHNQVAMTNGQDRTYQEISVELFSSLLPMRGQNDDLLASYGKGQFLRVADCHVKGDRTDHFIKAQQSVWIPGMATAEGMLGGSFNRSMPNPNRFLVTSIWDSEAMHGVYVGSKLPLLKQQAGVIEDTVSVAGWFVRLEPAWLVQPARF